MSKTKSKSRSEVEYLRGRVRKLESELKYYKKRSHFAENTLDEVAEDNEVHDVNAKQCDNCGKGVLIEYDFYYAVLSRCDHCGFETRASKRPK